MKDNRIYVTGSSGFLGKHLLKKLKGVTSISHQRISNYKFNPFSYFYFLSAYGNLFLQNDDEKILKANIEDLICCLKNTIQYNYKSFVFISTSSVRLPRQTMYSRSKKAAEEILLSYIEKYKAPICIIRPFSVTGVGEQPQHLIPTLIRSCIDGESVNFVPEPTHDFIDVDDVIVGILNLSQNSARGIFELGTGIKYSNQQVLDIVEKIVGKKANINIVTSLRDYDTENWVSNNFKSRGYGWLPRVSLEQSIKEMVNDYTSKKNN